MEAAGRTGGRIARCMAWSERHDSASSMAWDSEEPTLLRQGHAAMQAVVAVSKAGPPLAASRP